MGGPPGGGGYGAAPGQPGMGGTPPVQFGDAGGTAKKTGFLTDSWTLVSGGAVLMGIVAAAITFVLSGLGVGVMIGAGAGIGLVLAVVLMVVGKAKMLHTVGGVGIALVVSALGAGGMWFITHPSLHIDNQGKTALKIYVDGESVATVKPGAHTSVFVHKGEHKLGYSKDGDKKPSETTKAELKMFKGHLYNPGKTACYWLVVDVYGKASAHGKEQGPQPLQEFYTFDSVDNWFTENPEYVKVKKKEKGKVKTSLQHANMCMEFKACSVKVRSALIDCQIKALDITDDAAYDKAFQACGDAAAAGCKGGAVDTAAAKTAEDGAEKAAKDK
jgi:hypothetical protein